MPHDRVFEIIGFKELGEGRLEEFYVAEQIDGRLIPAGTVEFGFAGKGFWDVMDAHRVERTSRAGVYTVAPGLRAEVRFYGRLKGWAIRDGVLIDLSVQARKQRRA